MTWTAPDAAERLRAARAPSHWHEASGAAVWFRALVVRLTPFCLNSLPRQLDSVEVSHGNNSGQNVPYFGFGWSK